jgi:hypothetical protein
MIAKRIPFLVILISVFCVNNLFAQEINCQLSVQTPQIQASDKTIYDKLQTDLREFMNNRKWTNDEYLNQERIECSIVITISERVSTDEFTGNIQVSSRRPIYHSSYNSPMFNHQDKDFTFRYVQDQTIEFDEGSVTSNLTAILGFYAYIMIGLDYDSFSPLGGTTYFTKAQTIANNAQNLPDRGWKAFESSRNRYWLIENLLNVSFRPMRDAIYSYHRLGMDKFEENFPDGRAVVTESLKSLRKVYQDKPNSFLMQSFFTAKADEIVNIYTAALPAEKSELVPILSQIDPANTLKYQNILTASTLPGSGK